MAEDGEGCKIILSGMHHMPKSHQSREPIRSMLLGNDYPVRPVTMEIGTLPWADEYGYFLVIGIAERNVGFVKQVMLCLMLDYQLGKGSCPSLLQEVSFHSNCNASSKIPPYQLIFGRQPRSPLDLWCENLENDIPNSHSEYLGKLKETQAALHAMAR